MLDIRKELTLEPQNFCELSKEKDNGQPFNGEVARQSYSFRNISKTFEIVFVSGSGPNVCGHALLNVGRIYFFHIDGVYSPPKVMDSAGYRRYLKSNLKRELGRVNILAADPDRILAKLNFLSSERWLHLGPWHNCYSFVEKVLNESELDKYIGYSTAMPANINCPVVNHHLIQLRESILR